MPRLLFVLLLAGCSSTPERWVPERWVKMQFDEAQANCHAAAQRNPMMGYPTCMKALGWREL